MPPTDPLIYRLYEMVMVYGYPLKALIQEKFGDRRVPPCFPAARETLTCPAGSIMSAIDFHAEVEKVHENGADQVKIIVSSGPASLPFATRRLTPGTLSQLTGKSLAFRKF